MVVPLSEVVCNYDCAPSKECHDNCVSTDKAVKMSFFRLPQVKCILSCHEDMANNENKYMGACGKAKPLDPLQTTTQPSDLGSS